MAEITVTLDEESAAIALECLYAGKHDLLNNGGVLWTGDRKENDANLKAAARAERIIKRGMTPAMRKNWGID